MFYPVLANSFQWRPGFSGCRYHHLDQMNLEKGIVFFHSCSLYRGLRFYNLINFQKYRYIQYESVNLSDIYTIGVQKPSTGMR